MSISKNNCNNLSKWNISDDDALTIPKVNPTYSATPISELENNLQPLQISYTPTPLKLSSKRSKDYVEPSPSKKCKLEYIPKPVVNASIHNYVPTSAFDITSSEVSAPSSTYHGLNDASNENPIKAKSTSDIEAKEKKRSSDSKSRHSSSSRSSSSRHKSSSSKTDSKSHSSSKASDSKSRSRSSSSNRRSSRSKHSSRDRSRKSSAKSSSQYKSNEDQTVLAENQKLPSELIPPTPLSMYNSSSDEDEVMEQCKMMFNKYKPEPLKEKVN